MNDLNRLVARIRELESNSRLLEIKIKEIIFGIIRRIEK